MKLIVTQVLGLSTLSDLLRIDAQPRPSFLGCRRPLSHHPSSLTSVSFVPALHFRNQHPSGHTILIHSFHMPKLSQCSLIALLANSLSILALLRTSSLSIHDTLTKFLKHFISRTFTFLFSVLLIPHDMGSPLLCTTSLVQLLLHIDTSWPLSPVLYCSAHFSAPPRSIPSIHYYVYHISILSSNCHIATQVLKTIHFL